MSLFLAICTMVGFCFVTSFMLKALGKAACWVVGGAIALAGALLMGSMVVLAVFAGFVALTLLVALVA